MKPQSYFYQFYDKNNKKILVIVDAVVNWERISLSGWLREIM